MRYPNPKRVVYPTTNPPPFPAQVTTRTIAARPTAPMLSPIHTHTAFVDRDGNGVTDVVASHFHRVRNGVIQAAPGDGHYHKLTGLPAGAGAPFPNLG